MSDRGTPTRPDAALPAGFWERVGQARERLIALDYDGTLAPFDVRLERALPSPGVLPALRALSADSRTTVAILSGRPVADLLALLGSDGQPAPERVQLWGEHGWERLRAGALEQRALAADVSELLLRAADSARLASPAGELERKRTGLVLHTRALATAAAERAELIVHRLWSPFAAGGKLRLDRIDRGLELRAVGHDKGTAIAELLAESAPGALLVYVGDDETDEAAFEQVGPRGYGLRVARRERPTAADGTLASCAEVVRWLERLRRTLPGP